MFSYREYALRARLDGRFLGSATNLGITQLRACGGCCGGASPIFLMVIANWPFGLILAVASREG
jgi:hypothetical protein